MNTEQERASVTFYPPRRGVTVTDRYFRANGRTFPISGLADAVWGQGSVQTARRMTVRMVAVEGVLAAVIVALTPTAIAVLAALGYLLFATIMIAVGVRRWPTPYELWADVDGEPIKLYVSTDRTEFCQVKRALCRAMDLDRRRRIW
jgi:hypothetical protein